MKLKAKVAVLTGGSSGIGLATAREFKANGARLSLFGRDEQSLGRAKKMLGADVLTVAGDVRSIAALDDLYRQTEEHFGKIVGYERWASEEAHQQHLKGAHVQRLMSRMADIVAGPPSIVSYVVMDE